MRYSLVLLIFVAYAALCFYCWRRHQRQQVQAVFKPAAQDDASATMQMQPWLVAFASQTGQAQSIAERSAQQLSDAGLNVHCLALNQLKPINLKNYAQALFVVSTYGEGEAPDNGARFIDQLAGVDLNRLNYAVLALGDSSYPYFCAFGHKLAHALQHAGAKAAFDLIEVDALHEAKDAADQAGSLRHWQYYLGQLSGHSDFADWQKPVYEQWQLIERQELNTGSSGAPVFHLRLKPREGECVVSQWCAGDIVEIGPYNNPQLPHREYSIASTPSQGSLDLLVRQVRKNNGELGLGSGWLTHHTTLNSPLNLRIRRNPSFHPPTHDVPLILIGNGTGIAGLRAHLLARIEMGRHQNWLFFGERNAACDLHFGEQLQHWRDNGQLARMDVVFSREAGVGINYQPCYVQDLLEGATEELNKWLSQGAAIYVCGSLQGMAQGVDQALTKMLGREGLENLAEEGRYCRDVY
ncbi:MAG: sulfite reductase subunit alpha [Marinagarivorans sp.]|nr:sulfite reductase subunit alpha [Marinagarivorans sp.]